MDHAAPNLPSADFDRTAGFHAALGFEVDYRGGDWMILSRGSIKLEFFAAAIDPAASWHGACIRTEQLDPLFAAFASAALPSAGIPRLDKPRRIAPDLPVAVLVDPDGSLIRILGP